MSKSTISIDFIRATGTGSSGKVQFFPPRVEIDGAMLSRESILVEVKNGVGSVELTHLPNGFNYRAVEHIDNSPGYSFHFALPSTSPSVIQYEDIAQVDPVPATYTIVRTVNGLPPDPMTGNVVIEVAGTPGPEGPEGPAGADGTDGEDGAVGPQGPPGPHRMIFPLYAYSPGWHSASVNLDDAKDSGAIGEVWLMRVFVAPGFPVANVGTWLKSSGVLGAGGDNGFVIYNDACTVEHFRAIDNAIWTAPVGPVNRALGVNSIPSQGSEIAYRVGINVRGMSSAPDFPFVALPSSFSEGAQARCRFGATTFPTVPFNPLTFAGPVGGYIPFVALGS